MRDREGETADASNPRPAEASVGVRRSGQPLMTQLQRLSRLGGNHVRQESTNREAEAQL